MTPPITGGCVCGAVRYEVSEPFEGASYCHCTRCQRRSGTAASANARARAEHFRIVAGEDRVRSWAPPEGAVKHFCGDCGSALFSLSSDGEIVGVRMGTVDGDPGVRPTHRQFTAYAAVWEPIPDDGLPHHPEHTPR